MNIQEAKEEISRAIDAYLYKDESGHYRIPRERQRPILLMGAPGIGKTAIMRQLAEEKGLGLVSYTISHHTRHRSACRDRAALRRQTAENHELHHERDCGLGL